MMHIFLNALGANTASGLTYLRNVLPQLAARVDVKTTVAVHPRLSGEFRNQAGVSLADVPRLNGSGRRFWFEQRRLPILLRDLRVDVLISAGNFAIRKSSVPQILLSGNSLYISRDFHNDLLARGSFPYWMPAQSFDWGVGCMTLISGAIATAVAIGADTPMNTPPRNFNT